jgi:hypothetical protein
MSCELYYGPDAAQTAQDAARRAGRVAGTYGADGLKVDEARTIVSRSGIPPVGGGLSVFLVGPIDLANHKAVDTLLKTIEEPPPFLKIILWAKDLGEVRPTVVSRSLHIWCPAEGSGVDDELLDMAGEALNAFKRGNMLTLLTLTEEHGKSDPREWLAALAEALVLSGEQKKLSSWWVRARKALSQTHVTLSDVVLTYYGGKK